MFSPEVIKFIHDSRKSGISDEEINLQLFNFGWDDKTISDSLTQIANDYEQKRRAKWWFIRIFYGRINRMEFLLGNLLVAVIYGLLDLISKNVNSMVMIKIALIGILFIFFCSMYIRRISDTGLSRHKIIFYLGFFFASVVMLTVFLFIRGQNKVNEDGYPPKPFTGSLKNLFALN